MAMLIKNGNIVDVLENTIKKSFDIFIDKNKIQKIGKNLKIEDDNINIIDASGLLVCPGLIDMHVHLREPGYEDKETIFTGAQAAIAGGFTSIVCMPNTNPVVDNSSIVNFIIEKSKHTPINIYPVGAITKGSKGEEISEMNDMFSAGIVGVSDDGYPVLNSLVMRRAMEYTKMIGLPILSHCEDKTLAGGGVINEGYNSTILGLRGIPNQVESIMVGRDIALAELTGVHLHIQHVSTKESILLIKSAKKRGIKVTAETAPHYFSLTDDAVINYDTNTKVNPPLRTKKDLKAVKDALFDNTIDVIATDHAPHTQEEKDLEFSIAPFGINGLETSVGLVFTELLNKESSDVEIVEIIKKMSLNPANILKLSKGVIKEEADADITIIDPLLEWVVDKNNFKSRSRNTPFQGKKLTGKVVYTIVSGKVVFKEK